MFDIYKACIEELHSFDARFDFSIQEATLTLFYTNLGISEHPFNPSSELTYVDRAYVVFEDVYCIKGDFPRVVRLSPRLNDSTHSFYFGGSWLKDRMHREFEIIAKNAILYLPSDVRTSKKIITDVIDDSWNQVSYASIFNVFYAEKQKQV